MKLSMERTLFFSFIIAFVLLIVVQAALMNPSIRTFLTSSNELDGEPLGIEEFLYVEGDIMLRISDVQPRKDLKVLVNGDEAGAFITSSIDIRVKDGDVVEIDGSKLKGAAEVEVLSVSSSLNPDCIGKKVRVDGDVKKLIKVKKK